MAIDTLNRFFVSAATSTDLAYDIKILIQRQPIPALTSDEALTLAAWLVALADGPALERDEKTPMKGRAFQDFTRFDQILAAVKNT